MTDPYYIPPIKAGRVLAEDAQGQWHYLNHARTWQTMPNPQELVLQALEPDRKSQAAYSGQVTQHETVTIFSEDGTPFEKEVTFLISWDSILKIMSLIKKRASI